MGAFTSSSATVLRGRPRPRFTSGSSSASASRSGSDVDGFFAVRPRFRVVGSVAGSVAGSAAFAFFFAGAFFGFGASSVSVAVGAARRDRRVDGRSDYSNENFFSDAFSSAGFSFAGVGFVGDDGKCVSKVFLDGVSAGAAIFFGSDVDAVPSLNPTTD